MTGLSPEPSPPAGAGLAPLARAVPPALSGPPPASAQPAPLRVLTRFDVVERLAHWLVALMVITLVVTGAMLYLPALVALVGRRHLLVRVHVDVGLALPLPLVVSLAGKWGRGLRADLRRLNRWSDDDRAWFADVLHLRRPQGLRLGKFNAGQKLNAAFVLGALVVMLMTGSVMHWDNYFALSWRTGATYVHEWLAWALAVVIAGHILMALAHPGALRSVFTGKVTRSWALRHAPEWLDEVEGTALPGQG